VQHIQKNKKTKVMYSYSGSEQLFDRAKKSIPGGVNSPVRAFKSVGGTPLFIKRGSGAYIFDADDNRYIDYINSWGPMILGHAYPAVTEAVKACIEYSGSFGAPTEAEIEMAELLKSIVPNVDLVRMVNSGTEACMSALRLARGFTGRNKIIKFEGCYHGHADSFLVKAGSGLATLDIQAVPGVPAAVSSDTLAVPYNNLDAVAEIVATHSGQIAAIIVEPVGGNMGCIPPAEGFLQGLRDICTQEGIVLIFDEVMTGFRLALGGAQERFGIYADLVTYGKVIGGGMPVGAFGGRREIMEHIAPLGKVYQAGTLSGNPVAMAAGHAMLSTLKNNPEIYARLERSSNFLGQELEKIRQTSPVPFTVNRVGSMLSLHFSETPVTDFESAARAQNHIFSKMFHHLLANGVYLPPSAFESWFISNALSHDDMEITLAHIRGFFAALTV
jgi:glutamate-1-semialdehyde 2,1-aminomutase